MMVTSKTVKVGDVLQDMSHENERVLCRVERVGRRRIETRRYEYGEMWDVCAVWPPALFDLRPWERVPPSRVPKKMRVPGQASAPVRGNSNK